LAKKKKTVNVGKVIGLVVIVVLIVFLLLVLIGTVSKAAKPKVAIVHLDGPITISKTSGLLGGGSSTAGILKDLKKIKKDDSIKAVIIEINSPGGAVVASQEVANAVKELDKPTVALVREVGASGAYWVASSADLIVASEVSITGSIGVLSSYLEFSDLFEEYGVKYQRMVSGNRKDLGSPFRDMSAEEEAVLQSKLDVIHEYFITEVAKNRGMDVEDVRKSATGEFYLGSEALKLGLIDRIGDRSDAIEIVKQKLEVKEVQLVEYKHSQGVLDMFKTGAYAMGLGIGDSLVSNEDFDLKV